MMFCIFFKSCSSPQCDDAFVVRQWDHVGFPCPFQYAFRYFPCEVFVSVVTIYFSQSFKGLQVLHPLCWLPDLLVSFEFSTIDSANTSILSGELPNSASSRAISCFSSFSVSFLPLDGSVIGPLRCFQILTLIHYYLEIKISGIIRQTCYQTCQNLLIYGSQVCPK